MSQHEDKPLADLSVKVPEALDTALRAYESSSIRCRTQVIQYFLKAFTVACEKTEGFSLYLEAFNNSSLEAQIRMQCSQDIHDRAEKQATEFGLNFQDFFRHALAVCLRVNEEKVPKGEMVKEDTFVGLLIEDWKTRLASK